MCNSSVIHYSRNFKYNVYTLEDVGVSLHKNFNKKADISSKGLLPSKALFAGIPFEDFFRLNQKKHKSLYSKSNASHFEQNGELVTLKSNDLKVLDNVTFELTTNILNMRPMLMRSMKRTGVWSSFSTNMRKMAPQFKYSSYIYEQDQSRTYFIAKKSDKNMSPEITLNPDAFQTTGFTSLSTLAKVGDKDSFIVVINIKQHSTEDNKQMVARLGEFEYIIPNPARIVLTAKQYAKGFSIETNFKKDIYKRYDLEIEAIDEWGWFQSVEGEFTKDKFFHEKIRIYNGK